MKSDIKIAIKPTLAEVNDSTHYSNVSPPFSPSNIVGTPSMKNIQIGSGFYGYFDQRHSPITPLEYFDKYVRFSLEDFLRIYYVEYLSQCSIFTPSYFRHQTPRRY